MRMTFNDMVEFILDELAVPVSEQRATKDKVRKRLIYGLGKGHLHRLDLQTTDVERDELIYWARKKWKGRFKMPITVPGQLSDAANLGGVPDAVQLPNDLQQCHARILHAERQIKFLGMKNNVQATEILRLKPLAEQYERNCEKNRTIARKPRGGRA